MAYFDGIYFHSKGTLSMPVKIMGKFGFLAVVLALINGLGCQSGSNKQELVAEPTASLRPALKIWIVDASEIEREILVRWQAASDQALQIEHVPADRIATREPFNADIVIYPGRLLGDLVQKQAIGRLPIQAIAQRLTEAADHVTSESGADSWPPRWRSIVTYGGQIYAVPLGAPKLGAVMLGLDSGPLKVLDSLLSNTRDLDSQSMEQWTLFLDQAETALATSLDDRRKTLDDCLSKIKPEEKAWVVDRFLFIASTTNARSRGLFDLVKMEARLNQPDFSNSARVLSRMAHLFPETIAVEFTNAWDMVLSSTHVAANFAVGWPSSINRTVSDASSESSGKVEVAALAWNPVRGLIASVGKKTRQTAVSCQFLVWLSEPEQREALRAVFSGIELTAEQSDRNSVRDDYRAFQAINRRDLRVEPMELSLRMANANQYRAILADCLIAVIRQPDQTDSIMASCSLQWDQLTVKLGIETQRISEEQSLGYRK